MDKPVSDDRKIEMASSPKQHFVRFELSKRIEHLVMLVSFTILALTGLPQKFPESPISLGIVGALGGIEQTRQIHHISAVVLMVVSIYHVVAVLYRVFVLRTPLTMLPLVEDFVHLYHDILYYLGLRKRKAYYGRYNYAEKVEYLAVVWGTLIMGITGFMMWNPISTARWLPGQAIPAAKAAHGAEAILAVLAILLWHFYHVHLRHFNKSMFSGKLSREEMAHEHPAELAQIESGQAWSPPPAGIVRRRQKYFLPVAILAVGVMGFGMVEFITLEDTAITTVPRGETVEAFVPITPTPRPTPAPTATPELVEGVSPDSWVGAYESLFRNRCGSCHGITAVGGLSLATYEDALEGGNSGPAIVPGDPEASVLVQIQLAGGHPGQLTDEELQAVIEWIEAGAPEQ
jgi:cytochrome b subunit of formate dehydrogenase